MKITIAIVVIASWTLSSAAERTQKRCLAGLRRVLIEGHFTGPLICSPKDATFVLVGRTTGSRFSIYDYRYRYLPRGGNVVHGGQKLLIFQGKKYVGQYMLSVPPYVTATVDRKLVVLQSYDPPQKVRLDFSRGPPREVLINGELEEFFR